MKEMDTLKQLIVNRDFTAAENLIKELKNNKTEVDQYKNWLEIFDAYVLLEQNQIDEAVETVLPLLNQNRLSLLQGFTCNTILADGYWKLGKKELMREKIAEASNYFNQIEGELLIEIEDWLAIYYKIQSNLLYLENKTLEAIQVSTLSYNLYNKIGYKFREIDILQNIGMTYRNMGNYKDGEIAIRKALEISKELNNKVQYSRCLSILAVFAQEENNNEKGLGILEENLVILQELGDKDGLSRAYHTLGAIYLEEGRLMEAEDYLRQALDIAIELNNPVKLCRYYNSLGYTLWSQSNYSDAINCYLESLEVVNSHRDDLLSEEFIVRSNLGYLYWELKEFEKSKNHFNLCYEKVSKIPNYMESKGLFNLTYLFIGLIMVNIDLGEYKENEEIYDKLKKLELDGSVDATMIDLASALIYKSNPSLAVKFKSQEIFEVLVSEEKIYKQFLILAIFHLCDLYLIELKVSAAEETLNKLDHLIDKLRNIAHNQNIPFIEAQALILKSKISLIHHNVAEAIEFLDMCEDISKKNKLQQILIDLESNRNLIASNLENWKLASSDRSISDRLKESQVEKFLALALSTHSPK